MSSYRFVTSGERTDVYAIDGDQHVAVLTAGARSVHFVGAARTFTERDSPVTVSTNYTVRVAPVAWTGGSQGARWFEGWVGGVLADTSADVLGTCLEYLPGEPLRSDGDGVYAGDAGYGLDSSTADGADFYDFLGQSWVWSNGQVSHPQERYLRRIDCSGFVRLVFGYRHGVALSNTTTIAGQALARNSQAMAQLTPGYLVAAGNRDTEAPVTLAGVLPGDLVFFSLSNDAVISHVGIYLGDDTQGHLRFVSSRSKADGPTFGDSSARSIFDQGWFHDRLRRVIRL
jgi:cell wall-associated NlpC family hydrolase